MNYRKAKNIQKNAILYTMSFHEHNRRSLAKALTFRAIILVSDGIIIFAITHRYDITLSVMLFSNVASTVLYFAHERMWNGIHWGKSPMSKKTPLPQEAPISQEANSPK